MRLLITGSRTWTHRHSIAHVIDHALTRAGETGEGLLVIHGGANGADSIAEELVRRRYATGAPIDSHVMRAQWSTYGKRAGTMRNREMVRLGADLAAAFIRDNSPGASHCARLIEEAGIPLVTVTWEQRDNYLTTKETTR